MTKPTAPKDQPLGSFPTLAVTRRDFYRAMPRPLRMKRAIKPVHRRLLAAQETQHRECPSGPALSYYPLFSGTDQAPEFPSWHGSGTVNKAGLYLVSTPF